MDKIITIFTVSGLYVVSSLTQFSRSHYEITNRTNLIWLVAGLVGTALGLYLRKKKGSTSIEELNALKKDSISKFDRWAAGNYSKRSARISDLPFYLSFALPFILLLDSSINGYYAQVVTLYLISLATISSIYTITNGLTNKFRPLVFGKMVPMAERLEGNGRNAFFSGHVAITATACTFTAKVYNDFNLNSAFSIYLWILSLLVPAFVGYYRVDAGKHYPTDVAVGYIFGVLVGVLIPELH